MYRGAWYAFPRRKPLKSDRWTFWIIVAATASVLVVAIARGRGASARFEGDRAPSISLPRLEGGKAPLPVGRVTVVDFWATWCAPCIESMPRVQRVWSEYRGRGVELYSVNTDDPGDRREPLVKQFLARNQLTFPVVLDDSSASAAFHISGLPTMVLLDREGKLIWQHVGALNAGRERELRAELDRALAAR